MNVVLKQFIQDSFQQHYNAMLRSVDGLSPEEMAWAPNDQCSSIAFLVWHYARTLDRWVHMRVLGVPQVWEEGWAEKFGRAPADPNDSGFGFSVEQLRAFRAPGSALLLEYADVVRGKAVDYLDPLDDASMGQITLPNPKGGTISVATMCQQLIWEFNQHGGQIAYLRGIQRGIEDPAYAGGMLEAKAGDGT